MKINLKIFYEKTWKTHVKLKGLNERFYTFDYFLTYLNNYLLRGKENKDDEIITLEKLLKSHKKLVLMIENEIKLHNYKLFYSYKLNKNPYSELLFLNRIKNENICQKNDRKYTQKERVINRKIDENILDALKFKGGVNREGAPIPKSQLKS